VNYYPHHIGDYAQATRHLTLLEHGAYRVLLDLYYSRETPLPADVATVQRLACAREKDERRAVETVLREFFQETADGWRHGRCDREIETARRKQDAARENGKKGGRPPKGKPPRLDSGGEEKPSGFPPGNPPETGSKTPNPNPNPNPMLAARATRASPVDLAVAARKLGIETTGSHPTVIAMSEQGVTVETLTAAVEDIRRRRPDEPAPSIGYVAGTLAGWARDAARLQLVGAAAPRAGGGISDEAIERLQAKLEAEERQGGHLARA